MLGSPYPTRFLADTLRGRRLLSLERAVQLMTNVPARLFGLQDRGRVVEGAFADMLVFDPETVDSGPARRVYDLPGDSLRLTSASQGVQRVFVNGQVTIVDGQTADVLPGAHPTMLAQVQRPIDRGANTVAKLRQCKHDKIASMTKVESAWGRVPGYKIDVTPHRGTGRAALGDLILAESDRCLLVAEINHAPRLYFPESSVRWELFQRTDHHTVCPFKGQADYWTLAASDPPLDDVVWAYHDPFPEMGAIAGHVCFYEDRVRVEVTEDWGSSNITTVNRFPTWGDQTDLVHLLNVQPAGPGRFTGPPYHEVTRNVVEGGHLLGQAIVAVSRTIPGQRVTFASMTFPKAAAFDAPLDIDVDVLRQGKTFSTAETRTSQDARLRSAGLLLTDAGAPDVFRAAVPLPDVPGPEASESYDMRVTGRALRIVDGAYDPDPDRVGPPEIHAWIRFRDAPSEQCLHQAVLSQATTHWTIAAAMRPHKGFGQADAHTTLSTGIMAVTVSFHDDVDISEWHLYANPAIHAGRGLAQGEGHIFRLDGGLVASYTVQAMIRRFTTEPAALGMDASKAM